MEMFELRYFLAVAQGENIHLASTKLNVSPGSLSKAISRLEGELGIKLFSREGRNIRLTSSGKLLEQRASQILQLEESSKIEILGAKGAIHVVIAGSEILLSETGISLTETIKKRFPKAHFEYHALDDRAVMEEVMRGEAHLGLVTAEPLMGLQKKNISEASFVTCVGPGHPLYAGAKAKKSLSVEQVLEYGFVSPTHPLLGQVGAKQSHDGWRDDKFPRRVEYLASSLKLIEALVSTGKALAYLPDYFVEQLEVESLKITGCPYTCKQSIKVVTRQSQSLGWLNQLF